METKLDETINNICTWIDKELPEADILNSIPKMVSALAELVLARGSVQDKKIADLEVIIRNQQASKTGSICQRE